MPAETGHIYKNELEFRSGGKESERASEPIRKRELKRAREEASQRGSMQARKRARPQVSKRACGAHVGV